MSQPNPKRLTTRQRRERDAAQAADALEECEALLSTLWRLRKGAAKLLARRLEQIHFAVQCESDYDPQCTTSLNEMDVLDTVRLYLETCHGVDCLTDEDIERKYRPRFERGERIGA